MKPYPEYKPTGLAWLPEIPKHWDWIMLSQIATEQCNKNAERTERNVLSLSYGRIIQKKNLFAGLSPQDYGTYQIISPGNIVMRLTDLQNDHKSLRTGLAEMRGIITSAYTCLKTNHNPAFLHYLLHCYDIRKVFYGLGGGVRQSIGFKDIRGLRFPFPPADEQAQIVRYLDAMTAKINKLIRAKKRQIALLQEQKQAIITQAVTRGLDPDVELKDSGIDWLGPIPKHWTQNKVGHFYKSVLGKMLASTPSSNNDSYEKYLCAKDVHFSGIDLSDLKQMWFSPEEKKKYMLQKGDLLIVEGGAGAGGSAVFNGYEEPVYIQNSIHLLRPQNSKNVVKFLYYWLYSLIGRKYIDFACNKATIPHYTGDKLFETPFLFIPLEEQKQIVAFLDNACEKYNKAISNLNDEISHITEYKNSLNSSVVTGQVDVRNIAVEKVDPADLIAETDDDPTGEESLEESEE